VVHLEELYCEFRETRIIEDSESSAKWALSRCIGCAEGDRTVESSGRRYSVRRALSKCADRRKENSLSSIIQRRNPLRDLRRVTEHPEGLARGCLSEG
jgi:hypothetical protein